MRKLKYTANCCSSIVARAAVCDYHGSTELQPKEKNKKEKEKKVVGNEFDFQNFS